MEKPNIILLPGQSRNYTPEEYMSLPEAQRPVFRITSLTVSQAIECRKRMGAIIKPRDKDDLDAITLEFYVWVCDKGVLGWSNLRDEAGNISKLEKRTGPEDIDLIPFSLILGLAHAILITSGIIAEPKKENGSQSLSDTILEKSTSPATDAPSSGESV